MNFWDTSAIVPLLVAEATSAERERQLESDAGMIVWWGTPLECVSAIERLARGNQLERPRVAAALARLRELEQTWVEVEPAPAVRVQAERMLRVHALRGADALQLAAALVGARHDPAQLGFLTGDARLADAAAKEGFRTA